MLTHRRRDFTAGNHHHHHHFSFSNPIHRADDRLDSPNGMEYDTWADRIKGKYSYFGKTNDLKFGAWTRRIHRKDDGEEEFRWLGKVEDGDDDDSDVQSPTLWEKAGTSPFQDHSHIYPSLRAQTIAKYRQEMLEMVRDMPETAYELSLRDIVESPRSPKPDQEETQGKAKEDLKDKLEGGREEKNNKAKKGKKQISRSESMDAGGFLLKMFVPRIPTPFGSWRRSSGNSGTCAKVSPKPMIQKSTDGEWWNKDEFGEMSSSSNSNSSSRSRNRRKMSGCYSFFCIPGRESRGI